MLVGLLLSGVCCHPALELNETKRQATHPPLPFPPQPNSPWQRRDGDKVLCSRDSSEPKGPRFRRSRKYARAMGKYKKSLRLAEQRRKATLAAKMVPLDTHCNMSTTHTVVRPSESQVDFNYSHANGFVLSNRRGK